jgi:hypothetical protein
MRPLLLSFLFVLLRIHTGYAQEILRYDVAVAGISIGEMVAKRTANQGNTVYEMRSKVGFWFFGKINLDYYTVAHYKGRQFEKSEVKSITNRGNFLSKINWDGSKYNISARNYKYELDATLEKAMFASAATFCFDEPEQIGEMISEAYGLVSKITKHHDHYAVTVNGNTNKYYYQNGKMVKAVMEFPIKNYVLKLKE